MNRGDATDAPSAHPEEPAGGGGPPGAGTPSGDALVRAERAFELGHFAEVRRLAKPLATDASPEVARAAKALLRRVSIDPVQVGIVVACLATLAWVVLRYVL